MPWPSLGVGGGPSRVPTGPRLPLPMPVAAFGGSLRAVLGPADSAGDRFGRTVKCSRFSGTGVLGESSRISHLCRSLNWSISGAGFPLLP